MKRTDVKSHCPINFTLEAVGDPWSLLILRDIIYFGKHTFKDFLSSSERITTNILADRLSRLEQQGILTKDTNASDKRISIYALTEKGLDLVPMILEMMSWGTKYDPKSTGHRKKEFVARIRNEQRTISTEVQKKVRQGKTAFS